MRIFARFFWSVLFLLIFGAFSQNSDPIPSITIQEVVARQSVTIQAENFPPNQDFVATLAEDGTLGLDGIVVDITNSGSSDAFTATYLIPDELKGRERLSIRLENQYGYFSFAWFWINEDYVATESPVPPMPVAPAETVIASDPASSQTNTPSMGLLPVIESSYLNNFLAVVAEIISPWRMPDTAFVDENDSAIGRADSSTPDMTPDVEPVEVNGTVPVQTENSLPSQQPAPYRAYYPRVSIPGAKPVTLPDGMSVLDQKSSLLQAGDEFIILPIAGVLDDIGPGDSLESISQRVGTPVEAIIVGSTANALVPRTKRDIFVWTPVMMEEVQRATVNSAISPPVGGLLWFIYPVSLRNFSQPFTETHPGIDFSLHEGTPVYASDTGTVTFAGWNPIGLGNTIIINHGQGFKTMYAHLSDINVVAGQVVYRGNLIGLTGNSGISSGPHLHFELHFNDEPINPCSYILGGC